MGLTCLVLFGGAEGAGYGLREAGIDIVRCIEWDKDASATAVAAGFPSVRGDVRAPTLYRDLPPIDIVWSSPPCQDWSTAGKREGATGGRNGFPWQWLVIDHLRRRGLGPRWLMVENVTGMLTHNGKACGKGCCQDPTKCATAYWHEVVMREARARFPWADYRVLDAAAFGTPQFRRRVFLVAGPRPIPWPSPTHGPPTTQVSMFGPGLKPYRTVRDALGLGGIVGSGLKGSEWPTDRAAPCIRDGNGTAGLYVRTEQRGATATAITMPAPTVPTVGNQYLHEVDPGTRAASEPERLDRPAPCVTGSEVKGSGENANPQKMQRASDALFLATGRCRLTVRECAALFDMPADYPWQGTKTSKYRQIGNMVAWKCAAALGRAVKDADA